jgi:hypothetical protein
MRKVVLAKAPIKKIKLIQFGKTGKFEMFEDGGEYMVQRNDQKNAQGKKFVDRRFGPFSKKEAEEFIRGVE